MKYELTNETIKIDDRTLYRIRALKDFHTCAGDIIRKGDLGGFIENDFNLAQEGNCWVDCDAKVYENARVYDDAWVSGKSFIRGNARIFHRARIYDSTCHCSSWVYEDAIVTECICSGNSLVYGQAIICDSTINDFVRINGNPFIKGSIVSEYAQITDEASIRNCSIIRGNAIVNGNGKVRMGTAEHNARISQGQTVLTSACATDLAKDLSESIRTQTGLIPFNGQVIAYKQVRKNLTSFYDNSFQYKIGEWAIALNPEESIESCTQGLHFSNAGYWNDHADITNSTFLIARINLEDIITVQRGKIRCRKAFILGTYDITK